MTEQVSGRGPFDTGPLSVWRIVNCGSATPAGVTLPDLPELWEDEETPPPLIERDGDVVTMHFHGVARFRIDFRESTITAFDIESETADCVITHILHDHVAPRLLADLGDLVLHASTVRFGNGVALFLGETGAGKSTLATSLHQAGFPLLGDDAAIITRTPQGYQAKTVYPSLRLFPESITNLLGADAITSPMADYSDKQNVHLAALNDCADEPLPLSAIFFLSGDCMVDRPAAAAVGSMQACITLVEQSFSLDPRDPQCAARRLASLSQLALAVPAYRLSYRHDFARLGEVHDVIKAAIAAHLPTTLTQPYEKPKT